MYFLLNLQPRLFVCQHDHRQVIVARPEHPLARSHGCVDLQLLAPDVVNDIREWFRTYKTFEGKGLNEFGFGGRCLTSVEAAEVSCVVLLVLHRSLPLDACICFHCVVFSLETGHRRNAR
jgi:hypothetical protein